MKLEDRDPRLYAIVCEPTRIVYAQRETREQVEQVLRDDRALIERFGAPRIEAPVVVPLCVCDGKGYVSTESGPRPVRCPAHPAIVVPLERA